MTVVDPEAEVFLEKIIRGEIESFSEEDESFLLAHKDFFSQHILLMLVEEIEDLLDGELFDGEMLHWCLRVAAFLEDFQAFRYAKKICYVPAETIDDVLGWDFILKELSYILAATAHNRWEQLKDIVEDPNLNEFIREGCLDALVIMGTTGRLKREEVIQYLHHLFNLLIKEELDDQALANCLVSACIDFWPGECLEEIKELLGLELVDSDWFDIEAVLKAFEKGQEACIKQIKDNFASKHSLKQISISEEDSEEDLEWEEYLEDFEEINPHFDEVGRNDPCPCTSGKNIRNVV